MSTVSPTASHQDDNTREVVGTRPLIGPPAKKGDFKVSEFRFYVVCSLLISESIASSMLYSYVGLFVAHIEPRLTRSTAGYIAGFLVGCFQATQVIALPQWGRLSDRIGRKPVLLFASVVSVFASLLFGLSTSFAMAMAARAFHGIVAGGVSIAKTYVYEVTDEHSQARGFGLMNLMWALGSFVGPSVGGFLYDVNESPIFSKILPRIQFFDEHPALPPALAMSVYAAIAGVMTYTFVPESNVNAVPISTFVNEIMAEIRTKLGLQRRRPAAMNAVTSVSEEDEEEADDEAPIVASATVRPEGIEPQSEAMATVLEVKETPETEQPKDIAAEVINTQPNDGFMEFHKLIDSANEKLNAQPNMSAWDVFTHPTMRYTVPMYMVLCAFNIGYNEVFPLYAVAYREDGGLGFTSTQVGFAGMINAVVSVVANTLFDGLTKKYPMMTLWSRSNIAAAVAMFSIGFFSLLPNPTACLIAFLPFCILRTSSTTWAFSVNMMFSANAAPKKHLGVVTTVTQASASLARSITPMLAAPIFAWSISARHWFPFNHFLLFILCGFGALLCSWLGKNVPQEVINVRRR